MKFRVSLSRWALLSAALSSFASAGAASLSYSITDIGNFPEYSVGNSGQSFSGTGFVGLYESAQNGSDRFVHLFGVEQNDYSRTALQVDISGLAGMTITSAILSFDLLDGSSGPQNITVTSFTADGTLEYFWNSPDNLGSSLFSVVGSPNSLDLTTLLQDRIDAGDDWFGLHLQGSSEYMYTYTSPDEGGGPDSASVRLNVEFDSVPELPQGFAAGAILGVLGVLHFRKSRSN